MEDAHAAVLDLQVESEKEFKASGIEDRVSFFGVYDGHGGDKVAHFAGENIHKILAKQDAFKAKDFEEALKAGFLATDRAILSGKPKLESTLCVRAATDELVRSKIRRRSLRLHSLCWVDITHYPLCGGLDQRAGGIRILILVQGQRWRFSLGARYQG